MSELLDIILGAKKIELSHTVTETIPRFSAFERLKEKTLFTIESDGFFANEYEIPTQYGTHIDAPNHFASGKRALDAIGVEELILPLYVLHFEQQVMEDNDFTVSKDAIVAYEAIHGEIPAGAFVAFASDWSKRWDDLEAFTNKGEDGVNHTPGWTVEALTYLHEVRNVTAIGHETLDTDSGLDYATTGGLAAEFYWLSQDKYQVEVLKNLSELPTKGAVIIIAPVKLAGAPGFSTRAYALTSPTA